jgi:hypothetical protein
MWYPSSEFLAQSGHLLSGMCVVFGPIAILHRIFWAIIFSILFVAFMLIKELWIDPKLENEPFKWEGLKDCIFAFGGLTVAWVLVLSFA